MRMVSPVAACVAASVVSLTIGYYIGSSNTRSSDKSLPPPAQLKRLKTPASSSPSEPALSIPTSAEDADESGSESGEEAAGDTDLASIKPGLLEECKLVLVVRTDLKMTTGKIAAQCGHATLACYKALQVANPELLRHWERTGQAKIALRCSDENEMDTLQAMATSLNVCARSIRDAGRTQIAAGSQTVLGIGPAPVKLINQVTGKLKLL
ncbi:hypothetical protein FRC03_000113 [Tulasnella sp. 419]|nr:hypothetical protein FRC02_002920 [Tulasnella sp. 418]KAG8969867.1 hypothetical protein FRC03_000113 [Tulasnella sp. 419]